MLFRLTCLALVVAFVGCDEDEDGDAGTTDAGRLADGAPIDVGSSGALSCAVIQSRERMCTRGGNATLVDVFSCEAGDSCTAPSPYNEELPDIMCVDAYRFARFEYPATCEQVDEYFAGSRECLVPSHCAGSDMFGDWMCSLTEGCVCPPGGTCPTPMPAPGPDSGMGDAGVATDGGSGLDGGPDPVDGGPAPVDAGGGPPPMDGGTGPAPMDAGGSPAPP